MSEPTENAGGGSYEPIDIRMREHELTDPRDYEVIQKLNETKEKAEREGDTRTLESVNKIMRQVRDQEIINDPKWLNSLNDIQLKELLDREMVRAAKAKGRGRKQQEAQAFRIWELRRERMATEQARNAEIEANMTAEEVQQKREQERQEKEVRDKERRLKLMNQAAEQSAMSQKIDEFADKMGKIRDNAMESLGDKGKELYDWIDSSIPEAIEKIKEGVEKGIEKSLEALAKATETAIQVFKTLGQGIATVASLGIGTAGLFVSTIFRNSAGQEFFQRIMTGTMAGKEYTAREQREMERVEQAAAETKQRETDAKNRRDQLRQEREVVERGVKEQEAEMRRQEMEWQAEQQAEAERVQREIEAREREIEKQKNIELKKQMDSLRTELGSTYNRQQEISNSITELENQVNEGQISYQQYSNQYDKLISEFDSLSVNATTTAQRMKEADPNNIHPSTPVGRRGNEINPPTRNLKDGHIFKDQIILGREYSGHVIGRMQIDGLTPSIVEQVIINGERMQDIKFDDRWNYIDGVNKITVVADKNTGKIITIFGN